VAVEEDARRLAPVRLPVCLADDDRVAFGRPHACFQSKAAQIGGDVLGGGTALRRIGRIGRHRLDAQQREQPVEARVEIAVDAVENCRESFRCAHVITF